MATDAQIAANRRNAKASSGPKTAAGKARSSRNAQLFGLFSTTNCVQPPEQQEYDALCEALWKDLSPVGSTEQMFATEIVRGAWRLRRCAAVEGSLAEWVDSQARREYAARQNFAETQGRQLPELVVKDPLYYEHSISSQLAVDRARSLATSTVRRATAELRRLQTERLLQSVLLPANGGNSSLGLASLKDALSALDSAEKKKMIEARTETAVIFAVSAPIPAVQPPAEEEAEIADRTQFGVIEIATAASAEQTQSAAPCHSDPNTGAAGDTMTGQESPAYPHSGTAGDDTSGHPQPESPAYPHSGTAGDNTSGRQVPRSAPCPCGKGLKYKRCCGKEAPAVLYTAAA
jgi:hypothetical protein